MGKGIYFRGFLPHWDLEESTQAITFELVDSVPVEVIKGWQRKLAISSESKVSEMELHRLIARYEDAGHGATVLGNPTCPVIIQNKFVEGHPARYSLIDWCIIPNPEQAD